MIVGRFAVSIAERLQNPAYSFAFWELCGLVAQNAPARSFFVLKFQSRQAS
jgi:hypothetical protein